ncbi:MAG: hypothetical protein ACOCQR_00960 [bacterium]
MMDEDKKKALEELTQIRDEGKFNMYMERREIMQYANENKMFNLVCYVGNDVFGKYVELLEAME